ncbi:MAG: 3-deoxy-D-manno-octulosonic acid kinase [Proteobacteria bacterium]|nr:3-deoxy-D-manno-octulosonic acid kinase [Pseudomonadota bacterium]
MDNQFKIYSEGDSYILYDAGLLTQPSVQLFDRDYHTNQQAQQNNSPAESSPGIGRARVVYFHHEGRALVLKHYYRGGAVARILKDQYLGFSIEKSRAFKEWRLLKKMRKLALPVPDAVAAHVQKNLFFYRADLITEKVADSQTLADILSERKLPPEMWSKIGATIKLFHLHDIYHADLNARNILLTDDAEVYLIDFDNSYIRTGSASWKMANLSRLKRSLMKFKRSMSAFDFYAEDWSALLEGYK